jgi:hypothetical protein
VRGLEIRLNMTYEIKNEVQRTTAILNTINIFTAFTLVSVCLCSNFRTKTGVSIRLCASGSSIQKVSDPFCVT